MGRFPGRRPTQSWSAKHRLSTAAAPGWSSSWASTAGKRPPCALKAAKNSSGDRDVCFELNGLQKLALVRLWSKQQPFHFDLRHFKTEFCKD